MFIFQVYIGYKQSVKPTHRTVTVSGVPQYRRGELSVIIILASISKSRYVIMKKVM